MPIVAPPMTEGPVPPISTALVTGAGRGIGRAVATALARAGARVALVARTAAEIEAAAAEIRAGAGRDSALAFPCDVTNAEEVSRAVARAVAAFGEIDALVNAAGAAESAPHARTADDLVERMLRVNLYGPHHTMGSVLPSMTARRRGAVVSVASTAGVRGYAYTSAYTASKHALVGLTRAVAAEVAASGVRVNALCPGFVDTALLDRSVDAIVGKTGRSRDEVRAEMARMNASGRLLHPDEVAGAVMWLLAGAGAFLSGEAIVLEGLAPPDGPGEGLPIHSEALGAAAGYSQGMLFRAGRTLFVAGQVAWDRDHRLVGGADFAAQFDAALGNVLAVVREAGGGAGQIGRLRIYVADRAVYVASLKEVGRAYRRHMGAHYPAMALVEVRRLLEEGALVEIEAEAIL
ncbi:MAG: SDR family NAD(P)-dependent oxidoreductase [Acidobacteria bacterium]|nr:SDR family NAD(P)-dependent oxidoreductase [Acidobacteriota bacterium]